MKRPEEIKVTARKWSFQQSQAKWKTVQAMSILHRVTVFFDPLLHVQSKHYSPDLSITPISLGQSLLPPTPFPRFYHDPNSHHRRNQTGVCGRSLSRDGLCNPMEWVQLQVETERGRARHWPCADSLCRLVSPSFTQRALSLRTLNIPKDKIMDLHYIYGYRSMDKIVAE